MYKYLVKRTKDNKINMAFRVSESQNIESFLNDGYKVEYADSLSDLPRYL